MQMGKNYTDIWKKIFFVTFCIVTAAGFVGCGKKNTQENITTMTYNVGNGCGDTEKSAQTSGKMADVAKQRYYESLDELTKQGAVLISHHGKETMPLISGHAGSCTGGPVFTGQ